MSIRLSALLTTISFASAQVLGQEPWTVEELRGKCAGFQEESQLARLRQIGLLVQAGPSAAPAIAAALHGDHREYRLKVDRYLDQLSDERWLAREDAERTLIQIGARALQQIEERAKSGKTYEERIRCERILAAISASGVEETEKDKRFLRGLAVTASYLPDDERLQRALTSALAHTDSLIVEASMRAIGHLGRAESLPVIEPRVLHEPKGSGLRRAALCALGRMQGEPAVALAGRLLQSGELRTSEAAAVLRDFHERPEAAGLMETLAAGGESIAPAIAALAGLRVPAAAPTPTPMPVHALLSGREELEGEFVGFGAGTLRLSHAIEGLPVVELDVNECEAIETAHPPMPEPEAVRVFLVQGSLLSGKLVGSDADSLTLQDRTFGTVRIARTSVQGVALDPALDRLVGASLTDDRVRLRDGTLVDGRITAITHEGLVLQGKDGAATTYTIDKVAGILFRRPDQPFQDDDSYARIDLTDGERFFAHIGVARPDAFGIFVPGLGAAVVPTERLMRVEFGVAAGAQWGFTLVADYSECRVVEFDEQGKEIFSLRDVYGAWDAECLDNGNLLITEYALDRVVEVTRSGEEVWSFEDLRSPYDADRLPNGNTLIADTVNERVIEVTHDKKIAWEYKGARPFDCDRLPNGNTLIVDAKPKNERVIEIDPDGKVVWEYRDPNAPFDADRLSNGNTLITERGKHRVIEIDRAGNIVFEIDNLNAPSDADRLPNGHTIVAENGAVREFDRQGRQVWSVVTGWAVEVNRY
ncbi:MAG: hypothetical protein U1F36_18185 [Planctomycetota bacterium]